MRALVISHACVAEDNRAKWEFLARTGAADIEIHLPHRWPSWEAAYAPRSESQPNYTVRVNHAFRTGPEDQYFFAPRLARGIRPGNFDILHVEQIPSAFSCAQAVLERNLRSRKTKACFFTWINWEYPLRWPWRRIEPWTLRNVEGAIGGNRKAVDILRRHGFRGKTAVIPQLGVNPDYYCPYPNPSPLRRSLKFREIVIGFVGRMVEEKGVRILLEAVRRLKAENVSVLLLGNGPLEKELGAFTDLHLVHESAVSHDRVRDYLRAMDMLVLPSYSTPSWKEQFGHVLIEAMACEVPVIGSTAAAIPEVIGDAGLLFKEKSVEELHACLDALVRSPSERRRLAGLGRQRVLEHFTDEKIAQQTLEFWKTL